MSTVLNVKALNIQGLVKARNSGDMKAKSTQTKGGWSYESTRHSSVRNVQSKPPPYANRHLLAQGVYSFTCDGHCYFYYYYAADVAVVASLWLTHLAAMLEVMDSCPSLSDISEIYFLELFQSPVQIEGFKMAYVTLQNLLLPVCNFSSNN